MLLITVLQGRYVHAFNYTIYKDAMSMPLITGYEDDVSRLNYWLQGRQVHAFNYWLQGCHVHASNYWLQGRHVQAFTYCATRTPCPCLLLRYKDAMSMPLITALQGCHVHAALQERGVQCL